MAVNRPATYRLSPVAASASIEPMGNSVGAGFQSGSAAPVPLVASLAIALRDWPPIEVKSPPTNRPEPDDAIAYTFPFGSGFQVGSVWPLPVVETRSSRSGSPATY